MVCSSGFFSLSRHSFGVVPSFFFPPSCTDTSGPVSGAPFVHWPYAEPLPPPLFSPGGKAPSRSSHFTTIRSGDPLPFLFSFSILGRVQQDRSLLGKSGGFFSPFSPSSGRVGPLPKYFFPFLRKTPVVRSVFFPFCRGGRQIIHLLSFFFSFPRR